MNILGSRLSFKLPKVKVFKKKTEEWKREPEWSWQAVDSPTQNNNNKTPRHHHSQDRGHKTETRHRFLSRDQVDTIHQWLEQLPRPEEVATLLRRAAQRATVRPVARYGWRRQRFLHAMGRRGR